MQRLPLFFFCIFVFAATTGAQMEHGPYARISVLRPHDGDTVDFEAGYIRHLEWHRQAKDPFTWFGWTIWAGDRQRWFVYATFGHAAGDFDHAVSPAEDERDNIINVIRHAEFVGSAMYEFLPALSRGAPEPSPAPRAELTTFEVAPGNEKAFETAIAANQAMLQGETLWYRMIAGGSAPRYLRLRPRPGLAAIIESKIDQAPPDKLIVRMTVEILSLRPAMSYGLPSEP